MSALKSWTAAVAATAVLGGVCAWGVPVDEGVALSVAQAQVSAAFPGEDWVPADVVRVGDAAETADEAGAYGFVFALAGSGFEDAEAIGAALADGASGTDGESELYASTATVVTGADDEDSLVLRSFRGLAGWYEELRRGGGTAWLTGAGEIRRALPAGARGAGDSAASLKAKASARKASRAAELEALPDGLRALEEESAAEAAAARKAKWAAAAERAASAEE